MGFFDMIASVFGMNKREAKILVIGLDNSGKSTLINHLKSSTSTFEVTPTVGFQVEEFKKNNINFTVFDMSGQGRYRSLWEHYYKEAQAIIFVIDSTDRLRVCVAKEELVTLLGHEELRTSKIPIVFFANKVEQYYLILLDAFYIFNMSKHST
jgi:ADP-ribosylation factor-like protein 6